jgi:hypothetical protein
VAELRKAALRYGLILLEALGGRPDAAGSLDAQLLDA